MKKIIALTLALLMSFSCFSIISFAETETKTTEHVAEVPQGYFGVYTSQDLYSVRYNPSGKFILMNDIDLSEDTTEGGRWNLNGNGWMPIGNNDDYYTSDNFSGIFDGNGYSITGININIESISSESYLAVGLFSKITGTVKNLSVSGNYNIKAQKEIAYVGGIAGVCSSSGIISNCTNKININANISYYPGIGHSVMRNSKRYIGGIAGYGSDANINSCANYADITAIFKGYHDASNHISGISGWGSVTNCLNTGNITGYTAGTACGHTDCTCPVNVNGCSTLTATNCFNAGAVTAQQEKDGCLGSLYASGIAYSGNSKNCYNVGNVSGVTKSYAIGANPSTQAFYLEGTGTGSTNSTSLTDDQMKLQSMYTDWDFDTVWTMEGREDYPYPELRNVPLVFPEELIHKHEYTSKITKEATHLEEGETTYTCACGDSYTEPVAKLKDHTYTSEVTTEPTHLTEGVKTFTCACGDTYTESVAKLEDHTYTSEVTTEPTHLTEGVKTFTCACGDSYTEPVAKLEDHEYTSEITTPATHLTEGVKTFTCACGDSYTEPVAKLKDHTYTSEVTTEPTHLTEGVKTFTCACGDSYTEPVAKLEGHTYTSEVTKEATHLEEGETTYTCECGDSYTEAISKLTGHTYEKAVTAPTCTEKGYTTYTCECGDSYVGDYTEKLDHEYTSEITTPATHLTEGVKTFTCECGDSYTEPVAKLEGHTYTSEVTKEATHLEEGETTYTCECGDSYTEPVAKLTGHTYKEVVTEPTCTAKGYTTYTCECGDNYVDNYVGTKEHSYSASVTTPATHTKEGVMTYTCSSCGDTYTAPISKTPEHAYTNSYVVEPTCEKEGYTAHVCDCGDIIKDNYTEKTGHSYNGRVCEDCGKNCSCMCHYSGFMSFIWKIINFFYKLFRVNKVCACGIAHY